MKKQQKNPESNRLKAEKLTKKLYQEFLDRKVSIDHDINELVANHFHDFDQNGFATLRYIKKEVSRSCKALKKSVQHERFV